MHAGNLGASLAAAAARAGYPVAAVSRRDPSSAERVARRAGADALATTDPQRVADLAEVVFLTTVDDHIGALAEQVRFRPDHVVVHCSGATPVSVLDPARGAGARTGGFHPLQTFPDERGEARFAGVVFGIESADVGVHAWLARFATELGGSAVTIPPDARPLYHASAVMIGPLVAGLAGLAAELWASFGHDRAGGLAALAPLLEATSEHVRERGIPAALTGPFVRGDIEPVRAHLAALAEAGSPERQVAYAALALAQLPLAAERGKIPDERLRELEKLLRDTLPPGAE